MDKSKANILVALVFITIGCYVIYDTFTDFAKEGFASGNAEMNSAKYPRVLAGGLIALALLEIVSTLKKKKSKTEKPGPSEASATETMETGFSKPDGDKKYYGLVLGTLAVFIAYIILVDVFGYFLTTPVMLFSIFIILGVTRIWEAAAFSLVTTVVLYVLFAIGLELILPYGTIFS